MQGAMKIYTTTPPVNLELELRFIQIIMLRFSIINFTHFFNQYSSFSLYLSRGYCLIVSSNCWHKGLTTMPFPQSKNIGKPKINCNQLR